MNSANEVQNKESGEVNTERLQPILLGVSVLFYNASVSLIQCQYV